MVKMYEKTKSKGFHVKIKSHKPRREDKSGAKRMRVRCFQRTRQKK